MTTEEFLRDVCPNHTNKSQWNKAEMLHILELHKDIVKEMLLKESKNIGLKQPENLNYCEGCGEYVDVCPISEYCDNCEEMFNSFF